MSAFAAAMFTQMRKPERDVSFRMRIVDGHAMECPCRDFLELRREEKTLIGASLGRQQTPHVLDIGCGVGRHSIFVQSLAPHAAITLVESDQELRDYCMRRITGASGYEQFDDLPADSRFNLGLLMGNGLGIFGTEEAAFHGLEKLHGLMDANGSVLIEAGNFAPCEYYAARHEIEYDGIVDGPFTWGYATRDWLQRTLAAVGFRVISVTPSTRGEPFFICHAKTC